MPPESVSLPFSGAVLRETREEKGLSRPALARMCAATGGEPVSPQHIGRIEKGLHVPQAATLLSLATALGVSPRAFAPRERGVA